MQTIDPTLGTAAKVEEGSTSSRLGWVLRPAFLWGFTLLLVTVCLVRNHRFFHDDTFITLRYVRHLLAGYGPVWNTTGARVEGFTSTLHLLLVSAVGLTRMPLPIAARCVNFISHFALVAFAWRYLSRRTNALGAMLGAMIVAASWMFLIWDLGGLDAVLYSTLLTMGVLTGIGYFDAEETRPARSLLAGSVLLAFATLARPEGLLMLWGLLIFAALYPRRDLSSRVGIVAGAVGLALVVLLPVEIFRWYFFHQLVPNTFYAKVGGVGKAQLVAMGLRYVLWFLRIPPFLGLFALAAAAYAARMRRFTRPEIALWAFILMAAAPVVGSGGDHMIAFRFCLQLVPLLATVFVLHLYKSGVLSDSVLSARVAIVLMAALVFQALPGSINPTRMDRAATVGSSIGQYIHGRWPAGSVVGLNTAGSTPYYADEMQYIDMLGLNDAVIARRKNIPSTGPWTHLIGHLKGDGNNVLSRHPDYIILGPAEGTTPERRNLRVYFIGDYEIGISPVFKEEYEYCVVPMADGPAFTYYQRIEAHRGCPQGLPAR